MLLLLQHGPGAVTTSLSLRGTVQQVLHDMQAAMPLADARFSAADGMPPPGTTNLGREALNVAFESFQKQSPLISLSCAHSVEANAIACEDRDARGPHHHLLYRQGIGI